MEESIYEVEYPEIARRDFERAIYKQCDEEDEEGRKAMHDVWQERWTVESMTDASKSYTVARKIDSSMGCSCPAWKFHKAPKVNCKHIEAILEAMASVARRSRIFLDGEEFSIQKYVGVGTAFPSKNIVDQVMGRSNANVPVEVRGEKFKVSRVFLEE